MMATVDKIEEEDGVITVYFTSPYEVLLIYQSCCSNLLTFNGGGLILSTFFITTYTSKIRLFQGCLRYGGENTKTIDTPVG